MSTKTSFRDVAPMDCEDTSIIEPHGGVEQKIPQTITPFSSLSSSTVSMTSLSEQQPSQDVYDENMSISDGETTSTTSTPVSDSMVSSNTSSPYTDKWQAIMNERSGQDTANTVILTDQAAIQMEVLKRLETRLHALTQSNKVRIRVIPAHSEDKRGPYKVVSTEVLVFPHVIAFEKPLVKSVFNDTHLLSTSDLFRDLARQVYDLWQKSKFTGCKEWFEHHNMTVFKPLSELVRNLIPDLVRECGCSSFDAEILLQGVGMYSVNMWSSTSQHSMGRAIYPLLSIMNHSCNPNTMVFFQPNGTVALMATQSMRNGAEVTYTYARDLLTRPPGFKINDLPQKCSFQCICKVCRQGKPSILPLHGLSLVKPNGRAFETLIDKFSNTIYSFFKGENYILAGIEITRMFKALNGLYSSFLIIDKAVAEKEMENKMKANKTPSKKKIKTMTTQEQPTQEQEKHEEKQKQQDEDKEEPPMSERLAPPLFQAKERAVDQFLPMLVFCIMNASCVHTHPSLATVPTLDMEKKFSSLSLKDEENRSSAPGSDTDDDDDDEKYEEKHKHTVCHWSQETMLHMMEMFMVRDYMFAGSRSAHHEIQIAHGTLLCFYEYIQLGYSLDALNALPIFKTKKITHALNEMIRRLKNWSVALQHWSVLTFSTAGGIRSPVTSKLLHMATSLAAQDPKKSMLLTDFRWDEAAATVMASFQSKTPVTTTPTTTTTSSTSSTSDSTTSSISSIPSTLSSTSLYEDEDVQRIHVDEFKKAIQETIRQTESERLSTSTSIPPSKFKDTESIEKRMV